MIPRRIPTLAQALAILLILAPGLSPGGPSSVHAAVEPRTDDPVLLQVFDAAGKGVGCETGRRKFKAPRVPGDPPPPLGSEPTPPPPSVPEASLGDGSLDADAGDPDAGDAGATDPTATEAPTAQAPTILLANTGAHVAQADPVAQAGPAATPEPALPAAEPTTKPTTRRQARDAGLIPGIDVSHWQGIIDYEQVKKTGRRFVYIKATQDTSFVDPMFTSNMSRARAAGLAAGAYHFFDYTLDGTAQADHFLDRVEAANGIDGALPPVVDVECWAPIGSSTHVVAEARLRDFVKRVYERTGRLPALYASARTWTEVVGDADGFGRLPLWAACWGCDLPPTIPAGWDSWTFWQTGIDRVPGVGPLDGNFFDGSQRDLNRLKLRPFQIEGGQLATNETRVDLELGGRDAVQLRSSLDGEEWTPWRAARGQARGELQATEGEQTLYVQLRAGPGLRSPVVSDSITLDLTGPEASDPTVSLREGPFVGRAVPVSVRWAARDQLAGLTDATVAVTCGSEDSTRSEVPGSAVPGEQVEWHGEAFLASDAVCEVTAISRDGAGNTTRTTAPAVATALLSVQPASSVSATVEGRQVGIVALLDPDGGPAEVSIDGRPVGRIETYSAVSSGPQVVLVADLEPGAPSSVTIRALDRADGAAADTQVPIDGLVVLR